MNNQAYGKLTVPGAKQAIESMKYEIARELGVTLGADTSARMNGSVGGEITKRLVTLGKQQIASRTSMSSK
ncbi:MAG: alpha/beta-type small acid-soluble spore protein [Bacilli bacterium]|nr:alpha/beta-type small acid-soluble spore protein [Bacilli bacterium]